MANKTGIEWTDATWNPLTGCTKVSPGCDHCYAESIAHRFDGTPAYPNGFDVTLRPERLEQPLRWKRPRRIFVNSMSDLFHDSVPDEYIAQVFAVMALAEQHTFQVLTKRHARMRSLLRSSDFHHHVWETWSNFEMPAGRRSMEDAPWRELPLPNVWLGVSAENQQWADIRIPALLDTPAAVRFVSAEPLLGRIDLGGFLRPAVCSQCGGSWSGSACGPTHAVMAADRGLHWVIVGGESGGGARPMHPNWARGLRDQCENAGVAFLFKQRGEWTWNEPGQFRMPTQPYTDRVAVMHGAGMTAMTKGNNFNPFERGHPYWTTRIERVGKHRAGREIDGRTWDQYPEAVAVR